MTEASTKPLQTILGEFKNISPELTQAAIFTKDGEILAGDEEFVAAERAKRMVQAYDEIATRATFMGGVENLTILGVSTQIGITSTHSRYLAIVSSRAADEKMIKALACVIVPTFIKLLDQISPAESNSQVIDPGQSEVNSDKEVVQLPQESAPAEQISVVPTVSSERVFPKPPVNQFMVEKIGGLLVASDVVRVDADVVGKWSDLYGDTQILLVNVETLEGKSAMCKFRPIREADGKAKGIIQIPERILQTLRTGDGKLVMVKPVIPVVLEEQS